MNIFKAISACHRLKYLLSLAPPGQINRCGTLAYWRNKRYKEARNSIPELPAFILEKLNII